MVSNWADARLKFHQGHQGHYLPLFGFGLDALKPLWTFREFFTNSWLLCLLINLPSGLSAPNLKNKTIFEAWADGRSSVDKFQGFFCTQPFSSPMDYA